MTTLAASPPLAEWVRTSSFFFDFDGTISVRDVGVALLEACGTGDWQGVRDAYERGEFGSRECMRRLWGHLDRSGDRIAQVLASEPIDAGFAEVVGRLEAAGAEVSVVSDGFGFYIEEMLAPLNVGILSNEIVGDELTFPHRAAACPCAACGVCKQGPIREARARGRRTVFVGDGASDRHAARVTDVVFAKAPLADWCAAEGIPAVRIDGLADILIHLGAADA